MSAASDARDCWESDPRLHDRLDDAGWRYAALIGAIDWMDDDPRRSVYESDRVVYSHLIRRGESGEPLWHCKEATTFVCDLVKCDREIAAAWLNYDWGYYGACGGEV